MPTTRLRNFVYGMGRMYELIRESQSSSTRVRPFRDMGEAQLWLDLPEASAPEDPIG